MQFYVDDFDNDTCGLSAVAVGVWIRILIAMHRKRCGTLSGTEDKISKITRCSVDEINTALIELENDSVCEILRQSNGEVTITCRRLQKEEQKRLLTAERVRKFREKSKTEQPEEMELKLESNAEVTRHTRALYPEPEPKPDIITIFSFDEFWNAYGKKVDRAKCERMYAKVKESDRAKIKTHVPKYVASTPDVQYRKNPQTYLNGKCWNDEIIAQQAQQNWQNSNSNNGYYKFDGNTPMQRNPDEEREDLRDF
jgi:uncharacterized protein YdaU (DUF1376 family)